MSAIGFRLLAAGWFLLDALGFISRNSITMISGLRPLSPPFGAFGTTFLLKGSMSLDSQSPTAPYESSSFATPQKRGHNNPCYTLSHL